MLVYRLIIFDFDGVLVDSRESIVDCMVKTFKHFGDTEPSAERIEAGIGKRLEDAIADLNPGLTPDKAAERAAYYRSQYMSEGATGIKPVQGVEKVLEDLAAEGVRMALLSNKNDSVLKACVKNLGWERFFGFVGGTLDGDTSKPDPAFRIRELKQAFPDIEGSEILVVGDTEEDMVYARNMGVDSCLALYGYGRSAKARLESPDFEIESPEEIKSIAT